MTRESRLVATLLVISAIGVSGLMVVANQYRKALAAKPAAHGDGAVQATIHAVRLVEGFLAAREAVKSVAASYPGAVEQPGANADLVSSYRLERLHALSAHGMTYEEYAAVRTAWRDFRAGRPVGDPAVLGAFQARRRALDDAELGPLEAFDDAIK